ncbi:MAG TPA: carboxypeptidase-like regulatory domain-containing protein [Thermoanaerobaculia bacterium]|nr:carboxypeptidase-like regulatory domain-containing protein [Thermoanaerobaculia bacterium]
MIAILLATALALPPGAEAVRIGEDRWPEKAEKRDAPKTGQRLWWWSRDCAPQLLTPEVPAIECKAPVVRRVHVVDRDSNKKLPGARVIWGTEAMLADIPDAMLPFAIADAEGNALVHVPADDGVRVRVDGPRIASWWQSAETKLAAVPASPQSLNMNVEGEPATFVLVQFELPNLGGSTGPRSWAVARDGRVTLPALPPVPMMMIAWSRTSAPMAMNVEAAALPRTLELPRGMEVSGRIVDSRRRPLEGAAIEAVFAIANLPRGLRRRVQSTRAGTFVIRGIPAAPVQLTFRKTERATLVRGIDAGSETDLGDITLHPARSIVVRVIDADGQPVAGARVRAAAGALGTTGKDGTARLEAIAADDEVSIHVTASGFRDAETSADPDAKSPLVVEMSRGVRVIGRVTRLWSAATPVAAFQCRSASCGAAPEAGASAWKAPADAAALHMDVLVMNNGGQHIERFDESGAIDIGGLDEGTLALEIRAPGFRPHAIPQRTVLTGETVDLGALELSEGAMLSGRVVDRENDAPLSGVHVRVLRPRAMGAGVAVAMNDWIETTSDEDGAFRVAGLASGPHVLLFDAAGFAPRVMNAEAREKESEAVEVELDRARVLSIECAPIARCGSDVRLLYAGSAHPWASIPAALQEGKARIVSAPPGQAVLRFVRSGAVVHERTVHIGMAAETAVQVWLATATLRGTIMTAGRARRDGGTVELRSRAASGGIPVYVEHRTPDGLSTGGAWQSEIPSFATAVVDDAGNFVFEELNLGEYDATYRGDDVSSKTLAIVVRPGASHVMLEVEPLTRPSATLSPQAGRGLLHESEAKNSIAR